MNIDIIGDFVNYYDDSIKRCNPFICSLLKAYEIQYFIKEKIRIPTRISIYYG